MSQLRVRIVGERLPGRTAGPHSNVHIGVQKGTEVVDLVPGDAPSAVFDLLISRRDGDFRGPYVHGRPGERFLYLAWVDVDEESGVATMFSRIKVMLAAIPDGILRPETSGLEAYLTLTDDRGRPLAAAVRPPAITWASS